VSINDVPMFSSYCWEFELTKWFSDRYDLFVVAIKANNKDDVNLFEDSLIIATINSDHPNIERHAAITKGNKIVFDSMVGEVNLEITKEMDITYFIISNIRRMCR